MRLLTPEQYRTRSDGFLCVYCLLCVNSKGPCFWYCSLASCSGAGCKQVRKQRAPPETKNNEEKHGQKKKVKSSEFHESHHKHQDKVDHHQQSRLGNDSSIYIPRSMLVCHSSRHCGATSMNSSATFGLCRCSTRCSSDKPLLWLNQYAHGFVT